MSFNIKQIKLLVHDSISGFTPVRRKWSLLTGFATNKIDMVCNHCGYVKK